VNFQNNLSLLRDQDLAPGSCPVSLLHTSTPLALIPPLWYLLPKSPHHPHLSWNVWQTNFSHFPGNPTPPGHTAQGRPNIHCPEEHHQDLQSPVLYSLHGECPTTFCSTIKGNKIETAAPEDHLPRRKLIQEAPPLDPALPHPRGQCAAQSLPEPTWGGAAGSPQAKNLLEALGRLINGDMMEGEPLNVTSQVLLTVQPPPGQCPLAWLLLSNKPQ
jgi:hypothetical protein